MPNLSVGAALIWPPKPIRPRTEVFNLGMSEVWREVACFAAGCGRSWKATIGLTGDGEVLWSYLVAPRTVRSRTIADDLADQLVHQFLQALADKGTGENAASVSALSASLAMIIDWNPPQQTRGPALLLEPHAVKDGIERLVVFCVGGLGSHTDEGNQPLGTQRSNHPICFLTA